MNCGLNIMHTLTVNMELCSRSEHSHATVLKVFFFFFTNLKKKIHKSILHYHIIGRLDLLARNLRFVFYFIFLSTNSRISVYHVSTVNWINSQKVLPSNKAPVSGLRITDRNCSVSAAPLPLSAAVVLLGVLWSIHGARSDQKSTIVCPPPT